jgi:subtilisin family serine protease
MKIRAVPALARPRHLALPLLLLGIAAGVRLGAFAPVAALVGGPQRALPAAPTPTVTVAPVVIHLKLADAMPASYVQFLAETIVSSLPDPLQPTVVMRSRAVAASVIQGSGPLFPRSAAALQADWMEASVHAGVAPPDLTRWWRLDLSTTPEDAEAIAALLDRYPGVVTAFVEPELVPAAIEAAPSATVEAAAPSCPIQTPSYEPLQGYLDPAPSGIDAPLAWVRPGGQGQGVRFADIEGGWNARHEDLPGDRMRDVGGAPVAGRPWQAHGTAVLGVVAARDNRLGMFGIAPGVERLVTSSIGGIGAAAAIDAAQAELRPGDVLLIELQGTGPRGRFLPVEWWQDVFDAVSVATARGVIVVAAAGNGGEDLDHPRYGGAFDRSRRDSGAILVGAGAPPRRGFVDRARLDFSNYGGRVDVQGWGRAVATLDYGDLQRCSDKGTDRHYTGEFAGTSSASPIVAGAAVLLQGIYRAETGGVLSPLEMRDLLRSTGTPQVDGPAGRATQRIGPRPDLARALDALDRRISELPPHWARPRERTPH